jgi:hypothetical protein
VLDSIVITSDTTVKALPSVAYGAGVYLVSWTDNRTQFPDIYCARLLPDGTVLDVGGFPVHSDSAYQMGSNISFADSNFFVVWSSFQGSDFNLHGARVSPGGVVLDTIPIAVSEGSVSKFRPGIAFDGSNYLVLWDDSHLNPPEYDQWAARITRQGVILDTNGIPIDTSSSNQYNNDLGFLDQSYLACWSDFGSGEADLYARRISMDGSWIDTVAIAVCTATGHQETPSVFQDAEKFIVAWKDGRSGVSNADLYAAFVDSAPAGLAEVRPRGREKQRLSLSVSPNPFMGSVNIHLGKDVCAIRNSSIELVVFDVLGRTVRRFELPRTFSSPPAGISWNGCDGQGEVVPPGIYFFVLRSGSVSVTEKAMKIR